VRSEAKGAAEPAGPNHVLEFPGGYTRSVGPVIGRFLSELRDGRLVGAVAAARPAADAALEAVAFGEVGERAGEDGEREQVPGSLEDPDPHSLGEGRRRRGCAPHG
jgi:hypothetical protein